jgi:protein-S-isoprenylcysteine O-methyltransferase Ste14
MNKMLEERLGMFCMLVTFGVFIVAQVYGVIHLVMSVEAGPLWALMVLSKLCSLGFLGLIVYLTATRLPPRGTAAGLVPRLAAFAGTFVMMSVALVPQGDIGPVMLSIATFLIVVGTLLSIHCLRQLGRSFSIAPTARKLVTGGVYSVVRHPLYAAELIAIAGVVMSIGNPLAAAIGALWLFLQIARAHYEERVLTETFPEYADYTRRVPMLVPSLRSVTMTARKGRLGQTA